MACNPGHIKPTEVFDWKARCILASVSSGSYFLQGPPFMYLTWRCVGHASCDWPLFGGTYLQNLILQSSDFAKVIPNNKAVYFLFKRKKGKIIFHFALRVYPFSCIKSLLPSTTRLHLIKPGWALMVDK